MATYSKTYRATAAPSIGSKWTDAEKIYDNDASSYASRIGTSTSATHINGFGINLPSNAVVNSVKVSSKVYASTSRGHIYVYLLSDLETSSAEKRVDTTEIVKGASFSAKYVTQTYTGDQLAARLTEIGLHNGNVIEFLKAVRVRFVIGSTSTSTSTTCRVYDNYIQVDYTIPDYTLTVNAGTGGTVTGGGTYESGTAVTLTATPNAHYKFKQWSDGNTSATRTVTVSANATYTAEFELLTYNILTAASPAEGGYVTGGGTYAHGTVATLTAIANSGYKFVRWTDGETSASRNITANAAASYTAVFEKVAQSNTFKGIQQQAVYRGTKKQSVYIGTKKIT